MRGFSMRRRILEWVTSLLNMTPFGTLQSLISKGLRGGANERTNERSERSERSEARCVSGGDSKKRNQNCFLTSSGNLLNLGIPLDINLFPSSNINHNGKHRLLRHLHELLAPAAGELRSDAALHELAHDLGVLDVDVDGDFLADYESGLQGAVVASDDDGGVDVAAEEGLGHGEHLSGEDDDAGGAVSDLLVLGSGELDHGFGSGVGDVDFAEDAVAVVGHYDAAHGVEEHF